MVWDVSGWGHRVALLALSKFLFLFRLLGPVALCALEPIIRSEGHKPSSPLSKAGWNVGWHSRNRDTGRQSAAPPSKYWRRRNHSKPAPIQAASSALPQAHRTVD